MNKYYIYLLKNPSQDSIQQHPAGHHKVESESEVQRPGMESDSIQHPFLLCIFVVVVFVFQVHMKCVAHR